MSELPLLTRNRTKNLRNNTLSTAKTITNRLARVGRAIGRAFTTADPATVLQTPIMREGVWLANQAVAVPNTRALMPAPPSPELQRLRAQIDMSASVVLLENMARGDANKLIQKLLKMRTRLSNRALWCIFQCLFKAVVAMATPGRFHEQGKDPWLQSMAPQDETVLEALADGKRGPARPMVHFDLDPQNGMCCS